MGSEIIKFVILSIPRTGSSVLIEHLNGHPDILAHGEIFHPKHEQHVVSTVAASINLKLRETDPVAFLESVFSNSMGKKAVGFKIFEGQSNPTLDYLLKEPSIKKIILSRENFLASYSSLLISESLDYWNDHDPSGLLEEKVFLNKEKFLSVYNYYSDTYNNWRAVLRDNYDQECLEVSYSPTDGMRTAAKNIFGFLGLSTDVPMKGAFKKLNTSAIIDRFTNTLDVLEVLEGIGKLQWISEG